jgi:heme ABC exporter ATP-binding subunit CcmA
VKQLQVVDVARYFGRRKALSQVNFTCDAGEIVGLLGPNGAGKSTLLNILATVLSPSKGRIIYGDRTAAEGGAAVRAQIGMLGHDLFLYPELTARENLAFFGQLYGLADVPTVVARALEQSGLAARADDFVAGFSRGMRQRVALERALVHAPRLVLLDEPFTGLDELSTATLRSRLRTLRDRGCIVVVTTHDIEAMDGLGDRAVLLQQGRMAPIEPGRGSLRERYRAQCLAGGHRSAPVER